MQICQGCAETSVTRLVKDRRKIEPQMCTSVEAVWADLELR